MLAEVAVHQAVQDDLLAVFVEGHRLTVRQKLQIGSLR